MNGPRQVLRLAGITPDLRLRVSAGLGPAFPAEACLDHNPSYRSAFDLGEGAGHAGDMAARIYTRRGDDGTTGRFLGGRVSKASSVVAACGDVDEAVAVLGIARAGCEDEDLAAVILQLQRELFVVGADLATNPERRDKLEPGVSVVTAAMTAALETAIDERLTARPLQPVFLVPGTTTTSAQIDLARAVVRRAERHAVAARAEGEGVADDVLQYLNRLSDLLYVLARDATGPESEPVSH